MSERLWSRVVNSQGKGESITRGSPTIVSPDGTAGTEWPWHSLSVWFGITWTELDSNRSRCNPTLRFTSEYMISMTSLPPD